jgi:hypothetical protein
MVRALRQRLPGMAFRKHRAQVLIILDKDRIGRTCWGLRLPARVLARRQAAERDSMTDQIASCIHRRWMPPRRQSWLLLKVHSARRNSRGSTGGLYVTASADTLERSGRGEAL